MGQEQSCGHASASIHRYKENKYEDPVQYRRSAIHYATDYEGDYKRHRPRRSQDSFNSDHSTESSGYRSGSNYDYRSTSERSTTSDYCRLSLYKNDHYKDVNKELYRPVKIPKEKRYKSLDLDKGDAIKASRIKSYLDAEQAQLKSPPKKAGIRNYTPKILEDEQKIKLDNWL